MLPRRHKYRDRFRRLAVPWYPQKRVTHYCKANNIYISAWGPIFRGRIHEVPLLQELAEKYQKTPAQITLVWADASQLEKEYAVPSAFKSFYQDCIQILSSVFPCEIRMKTVRSSILLSGFAALTGISCTLPSA